MFPEDEDDVETELPVEVTDDDDEDPIVEDDEEELLD